LIRSMVPTEVPPYFCTMSPMAPARLRFETFNAGRFRRPETSPA
jgi:hypothetical protein